MPKLLFLIRVNVESFKALKLITNKNICVPKCLPNFKQLAAEQELQGQVC